MVDMTNYIIAKSDQLNADDLLDAPRTITITKVTAAPDAAEQPVSIHYEGGEGRPWKPCKTMRRILVGVWGKDASKYAGRSLTLYRDPAVAFGGMQVGGIRVSHMSHIESEKTVALMVTRGRKAPFKILPLKNAPASAAGAATDGDQDAALASLTEAAAKGTTALANVWKQKGMAPFRDALQLDLERLKAVAAEADSAGEPEQSDRPAEQPAEVNDALSDSERSVAKTIADLEAAADADKVEEIIKGVSKDMVFLDDALQLKLEIAFDNARNRVKAAEPVA